MKAMKSKKAAILCAFLILVMIASAVPASAAKKTGGWTVSKARYSFLTSAQKTVFKKATKNLTGVNYKAVAVVATQVVAGTNYAFLCQGTTVTKRSVKSWYILTVNKDLNAKVRLLSSKKINLSDIQTTEHSRKLLDGCYNVCSFKYKAAALSGHARKVFKNATEGFVGYGLRPIALLGTQVVSGTNYRFLVCAKGIGGLVDELFVVDVYENLSRKCKLSSVEGFYLEKYTN